MSIEPKYVCCNSCKQLKVYRESYRGIDCEIYCSIECYHAKQEKKIAADAKAIDVVNRPSHYIKHPSGIECIEITSHMGFCLGNAMKYIWRADLKNGLEDLQKAKWYIEHEITKRLKAEDSK